MFRFDNESGVRGPEIKKAASRGADMDWMGGEVIRIRGRPETAVLVDCLDVRVAGKSKGKE